MPDAKARRPWWAVAIAGGFGAVLGVATVFGVIGNRARGETQQAQAAVATATGDETQRWREQVDARLRSIEQSVARIEGRLEKR